MGRIYSKIPISFVLSQSWRPTSLLLKRFWRADSEEFYTPPSRLPLGSRDLSLTIGQKKIIREDARLLRAEDLSVQIRSDSEARDRSLQ